MALSTDLQGSDNPDIFKLRYKGKIVGLRVKKYDIFERNYKYYDFETSYIKNKDLRDYLTTHSEEFQTLELIEHNGLVCTADEISGEVLVNEFKSVESASDILAEVVKIKKCNEEWQRNKEEDYYADYEDELEDDLEDTSWMENYEFIENGSCYSREPDDAEDGCKGGGGDEGDAFDEDDFEGVTEDEEDAFDEDDFEGVTEDEEDAFDDGYSDEDFGEVEEEVSTVNKLYSNLNDEQIKLLKRYYLWFSQRIFDEGKQKARTLQVTSNPRKLQKQRELNVMRNNGGMWAYAGFIDMGYRGAEYCTLGHPLRYVHLAWDISVSDIETSFFGEEYTNDIEDVINSSNCIKFGIDCISDFFEIDKEYTDMLKRAQREAIKDMDFMCSYYENGLADEVISSFTIMDEIVNNIVKIDAKGLLLDKDYKCLIPKSLSSFYRQFRGLGMVVPKSLVQEIRDNMIGWETHKFIKFRYPLWMTLSAKVSKVIGKESKDFLDSVYSNPSNSYSCLVRDYFIDFFELSCCGCYEFNADTFKDEGGSSKGVKAQLHSIKYGVRNKFWSDVEYTFDYIKKLSKLHTTIKGIDDLVCKFNTPTDSYSISTGRYYVDDKHLGVDFDALKHYDEDFSTELYTTLLDDLKYKTNLGSNRCKKSYNERYTLVEFQEYLDNAISTVTCELERYLEYATSRVTNKVNALNEKKDLVEKENAECERQKKEELEKKRLEEEEKKKKAEESSKKLSDDEIISYCYENRAKVKGVDKLKFPLTVLDTVHKTSKHSPKQMLYILKVYKELTGVDIDTDIKPQKTNLGDRKDIEDAIDKVLADPDLLENESDMEKVYAILTSIKKYRSISEKQMKYAEIALKVTAE